MFVETEPRTGYQPDSPPPFPPSISYSAPRPQPRTPILGHTVYMCPDCGGYGLSPITVEHRPDCWAR